MSDATDRISIKRDVKWLVVFY